MKIADPSESEDADLIQAGVDDILSAINQSMSTWLEDSELSRINRDTSGQWLAVSPDLWQVLLEARRISELSDGAFDITIGPLVNLWGFGPGKYTSENIPSPSDIRKTLQSIGYEKIGFDKKVRNIRKTAPDLYIDLSAIAKGFAVDRVAGYLESRGHENYMVEIGGEVRVRGQPDVERGWRVGIEKPLTDTRAIQKIIELTNMAMATSGDYRNYVELDGIRYSHTIDPETGRPVQHDLGSVTVLHESSMTADALATAYTVMGPEAGMALARKLNTPAYFIIRGEDDYIERYTGNFEQYIYQQGMQ